VTSSKESSTRMIPSPPPRSSSAESEGKERSTATGTPTSNDRLTVIAPPGQKKEGETIADDDLAFMDTLDQPLFSEGMEGSVTVYVHDDGDGFQEENNFEYGEWD
jgi:hypothetical protein